MPPHPGLPSNPPDGVNHSLRFVRPQGATYFLNNEVTEGEEYSGGWGAALFSDARASTPMVFTGPVTVSGNSGSVSETSNQIRPKVDPHSNQTKPPTISKVETETETVSNAKRRLFPFIRFCRPSPFPSPCFRSPVLSPPPIESFSWIVGG